MNGQDGSVQASKIERITPTGTFSEFPLPSAHTSATDIITGPDGNLWFTEGGKIARITPTGKISEFPLPSATTFPSSITTGPDGNLWFTEQSKIGRMTLTGKVSEFSLPFHQYPAGSNLQRHQLALPRVNRSLSQQERMAISGSPKLEMGSLGPLLGASPLQAKSRSSPCPQQLRSLPVSQQGQMAISGLPKRAFAVGPVRSE